MSNRLKSIVYLIDPLLVRGSVAAGDDQPGPGRAVDIDNNNDSPDSQVGEPPVESSNVSAVNSPSQVHIDSVGCPSRLLIVSKSWLLPPVIFERLV